MKKWKKNLIFVGVICIITISMLSAAAFLMSTVESESSWEDDYYSVKFHKDYFVLKVPYNLEDGEQYDTIRVDKFLPLGDDNSYGFLRVNETTGKMEFRKWRHSNLTYVKVLDMDNETDITDTYIWVNFWWNDTTYNRDIQLFRQVYKDRGEIIFDDGKTVLVDDYIFGLTIYARDEIYTTVLTLDSGTIIFDMIKNKFLQVREIDPANNTVFCGGFTNFYNDANTTIVEQYLSPSYIIDNCILIWNIDTFPHAEYVESVGGWRVKASYAAPSSSHVIFRNWW